jgi:hypothetical protein
MLMDYVLTIDVKSLLLEASVLLDSHLAELLRLALWTTMKPDQLKLEKSKAKSDFPIDLTAFEVSTV